MWAIDSLLARRASILQFRRLLYGQVIQPPPQLPLNMASAAARLKYARALEVLSAQEAEQAASDAAHAAESQTHAAALGASEARAAAAEGRAAELARALEEAGADREALARAEVAEGLVAALTADIEAVKQMKAR
jgi:hypothetical protein